MVNKHRPTRIRHAVSKQPVIDLFRELLAGTDDAEALTSDRGVLTFAALRQQVEIAAETLYGSDVKRLGFCFLPNSLTLVIAYLGAVTRGHAVGLFPPATPANRKRHLVELYRPEVVLTCDDDLDEFLRGLGYRPLTWPCPEPVVRAWAAQPVGGIAADLALLLSTSGSTGTPKLVRLSASNIAANAAGIANSLGISPSQRAVTSVPLFHSYGLSIVSSHLSAGSAVAVTERSPLTHGFWQFAHEHRVVEVAGTPLLYRTLFGPRAYDLPPSVRVMTQAGARLGNDLARSAVAWMKAAAGRFYCMYGQTEATSRISCLDASHLAAKLGSVGTALGGGLITAGPPEAGGTDGPIRYRGPNVMLGYAMSRDDLSRGREVETLNTGDLGRLDSDGFLYVTGRSSRFVKLLDRRLSLDDVEEWFRLPDRCAAVPGGPEKIVVFTAGQADGLEDSCRALAAALDAPISAIRTQVIEAIPRMENGKVDYIRLEELARDESHSSSGRSRHNGNSLLDFLAAEKEA
jgi:acyl-CoA synthetase (AMP-forming)/AMP-acid ligase II